MCPCLFGCLYVFRTQCTGSSHVLQVIHCAQFVFVSVFVCVDNWPAVGRSENCFRFPSVLLVLPNYTTVKASSHCDTGVHINIFVNSNTLIYIIKCMLAVELKGYCVCVCVLGGAITMHLYAACSAIFALEFPDSEHKPGYPVYHLICCFI